MKRFKFEIVFLTLLGAAFYWLIHDFNDWVFKLSEFSAHVNWIYLPAFLRLANVLVLGPLFGSVATALGVCLICFFQGDPLLVLVLNSLAAALGPLVSLYIFKIFKGREVHISVLSDLLLLVAIYSVMNALAHHSAWAIVDPDQFLSVSQLPIMVVGDFTGACLGAILFSALVHRLGILNFVKQRVGE